MFLQIKFIFSTRTDICARIRTWLRMHGFKSANTISDDEIMTIIARAAQAEIRNRRYRDGVGGERYMAPLRPDNAPNNAESGMALRDNNVPYAPGFMEWAGLEGDGLYADYEFLYAKHWTKAGKSPYFSSPEMAQAATELVLAAPEKVKDINENMSFVGRDEETGKIYRIEIQKQVKGKRNHIRSVFEITQKQYEKCKLETSPVLQLSPTEDKQSAGRTISSIMKKNLAHFSQKCKSGCEKIMGLMCRSKPGIGHLPSITTAFGTSSKAKRASGNGTAAKKN